MEEFEANSNHPLDENAEETKDENQEEEEDSSLDAVKKYQSRQENHSCLMPKNMEAEVVVNTKPVPIMVAGDGAKDSIKIAPGEGKIPTNMMREKHMDVKAFPRHHPSGNFGFNHEREFILTLFYTGGWFTEPPLVDDLS